MIIVPLKLPCSPKRGEPQLPCQLLTEVLLIYCSLMAHCGLMSICSAPSFSFADFAGYKPVVYPLGPQIKCWGQLWRGKSVHISHGFSWNPIGAFTEFLDAYLLDPKISQKKKRRPNWLRGIFYSNDWELLSQALDHLLVVIIIPSMLSSGCKPSPSALHVKWDAACQGWGLAESPRKWRTHRWMLSRRQFPNRAVSSGDPCHPPKSRRIQPNSVWQTRAVAVLPVELCWVVVPSGYLK